MYNSDTEVLFPFRAVPALKGLRGPDWDHLIDEILSESSTQIEQMAFVLMVVRLVGCSGCNSDSYRAMRGCTKCAQQSIKRYRGEDSDLLKLYEKAKQELNLNKKNI